MDVDKAQVDPGRDSDKAGVDSDKAPTTTTATDLDDKAPTMTTTDLDAKALTTTTTTTTDLDVAAPTDVKTPAMAAPHSPILKLPLEVLIRIAACLTTPELCALRLACRAMEQLLYVTFVNEFFTRKQFMNTDNSLQALVDISKSRLGPHLRQLHLGLDRFSDGIQRPLADEAKERRYKQRYADFFTLWNTGANYRMLVEALAGLRNLDEVVVRDFNSKSRTRDGPAAEWYSYGSTTIFNETGVRLSSRLHDVWELAPGCMGNQVFSLLLHALGAAHCRPKAIRVMARRHNELRDYAFNIPRSAEPSVLPVLHGLEKLHLTIDLSWRSPLSGWGLVNGAPSTRSWSDELLRRFLSLTPNLRDLRINERHDYNPGLTDFLDWLADAPPAPAAAAQADRPGATPPVALPHLESLSLGFMSVTAQPLLRVIRKFAPRLRGLELWKVTLQRLLPPNSDPSDPPRDSFWADFFTKLRETPDLGIRHFKAGMLKQAYKNRPRDCVVSFKRHGLSVAYTGPCWRDFIEDVTQAIDVKWPRTVTPEQDSEGDSSVDDTDVIDGEVVLQEYLAGGFDTDGDLDSNM
ncbi:hypothetical protein CDD83_7978 [Cordyceps sp. RAO-2017]|nr:hypothetical protein CDD83_7978 [Cordyceps sp. RAO-2017]